MSGALVRIWQLIAAALVALFVHALIAGALVLWMEYRPVSDMKVELELSSVELSFAEQESDAPAADSPVAETPEKTVSESKPGMPELPSVERPPVNPPDPAATKFVEQEERPEMSPPVPRPEPRSEMAPRQARIDAPPRPKRSIRPDYPRGARVRGEEGEVTVELHVGASGSVDEAHVVSSSGFPELDSAAVKAVLGASFRPAESGGAAVAATARVKLSFRLH